MKTSKRKKLPRYVVLKGGEWHLRRTYPTKDRDAKGRVRYIQISRKCEPETPERALEIAAQLDNEYRRIKAGVPDAATVLSNLEDVLATKKHSIGRTAYGDYVHLKNYYIAGTDFGRMRLADVQVKTIETLYRDLMRKGTSAYMIRKLHILLKMSFGKAVLYEDIAANPAHGVELPAVFKSERKAFTERQAFEFMRRCRQTENDIVFEFALETGFRQEEYIATRWSDVDLDKCAVDVRQAIVFPRTGGGFVVKAPKTTSSRRTIDFSPQMRDRLIVHKRNQDAYIDDLRKELTKPILLNHMKRLGSNFKKRQLRHELITEALANFKKYGLVFPSANGKPMSPMNLARRRFAPILERCGFEKSDFPLNSLRHSHASIMAKKLSPKKLQYRMGHRRVETTLTYYVHILEDDAIRASDLMAETLYKKERSNVLQMK